MDEYNNKFTLPLEEDTEITEGRIAAIPSSITTRQLDESRGSRPLFLPSRPELGKAGYLNGTNRKLLLWRSHKQNRNGVARFVLFTMLILFSLITSGSVGAFAYYQSQAPLLNSIAQHTLFQTTRIYDRNGQLLYQLNDPQHGRRTYVNYNDVSPLLVNATVAAEDHTFWVNSGIDLQGIARAAFSNLQRHSVVEGGSTITQQLIKNMFFSQESRSIQTKSEESILAYGLTQQYPKWKIMEMYLNTVYYGDLNYGVEAAAQDYFNIQPKCIAMKCASAVSQLNLAQASLLAGLPQSPSQFNPVTDKPAALARQKIVLQAMIDLKMITSSQARQAEDTMAQYTFQPYTVTHPIVAPHFVHYLIDQVLIPLIGAQSLFGGGYNIYTTLDLDLEKHVEQITHNHLYNPAYGDGLGSLSQVHNVNNAAVVVMNPFNGEILAMNGSADYNKNSLEMQGQYNAAAPTGIGRQPGSSFKPIVYATALEMGWYPAMIIPDHKTIYPGGYSPPNYDGTYHTNFPMTARAALANSLNIPAVDAIEYTGIPNTLNMAGRLGLTEVAGKSLKDLGPSMVLGTKEVSLLHLTSAYATFANRGVRVAPTAILGITNGQGQSLYTYDAAHPQGVQAVREDVAFLMSSMLSDKTARYHEFSPGNPLELDRPAAAKTGTTDSFRDNWTMGYTPYLTAGVWAGNSDNSKMTNVIGITGAAPIWHDVMEYASQRYHYPVDDFVRPSNVNAGTVSATTGLLPHLGEPTVTDWFIDGTMPTIQGSDTPATPCTGDNCPQRCPFPFIGCLPPLPFIGVRGNGNN